jgi:hypothetical protein
VNIPMVYLLIAALAAGLWWMARAKEKRAAEHADAVRRTYTKDIGSSAWIRRNASELAGETPDAADVADAPAVVLELGRTGGFQVPKQP